MKYCHQSKWEDFVSLTLPLVVTAGLERDAILIDVCDTPKSSDDVVTSLTCIMKDNKAQGNVAFYHFCHSVMINLVVDVIIHVKHVFICIFDADVSRRCCTFSTISLVVSSTNL